MDRQVFFFHVMKTAGTSLLRMLDQALGDGLYPSAREREANAAASTARLPQYYLGSSALVAARASGAVSLAGRRAVIGHYPWILGRMVLRDPFMATVLREPVARTLSMLDHRIRLHEPDRTREELLEEPRFVNPFVQDYQTKVFSISCLSPAADILHMAPEASDAAFARAKDRLLQTDFVGLAEDFGRSVALLSRKTGIQLESVPEARENVGSWAPPSESLRRRILQLVPRDVELYALARERFVKEVGLL